MIQQLDDIKKFFIETVRDNPRTAVNNTIDKFGITRQAVNKHAQQLVEMGLISVEGQTKATKYSIVKQSILSHTFEINKSTSESDIWSKYVSPHLKGLPSNVYEIWQHGFTEMFNNAIDHSESDKVSISLELSPFDATIIISDLGVGIFKKIQKANNLEDERHSLLELAKGKFTTDPARHSGEGIFFTSRMFEKFTIVSGHVLFAHDDNHKENVVLDSISDPNTNGVLGTLVLMKTPHDSKITLASIFDDFSSPPDSYEFDKTIVPVHLAQMGDDNLISRSQAKRLLARLDKFRVVNLDFKGVESVGQAFADEIFRVYRKQHPEVKIVPENMAPRVDMMVKRALANKS
ncbi:MAG: DUF4325 domain-containing protein [Rickettsiaceae bacterium]